MKNAWKKFLAVTLSAAMLMSNNVMTLAADEEIPTEQPSSVVEETVQKDQDGQNAAEKTPEIVTEPEEQQPVQEQPAENVSADLTGEKKEEIPAPEEVAEESTVAETENLAQRSQENVFSEDAKGDSKESVATSAPNENIQEKVKKQSPIRRAVTLNNGEQDLTGITGTDGLTITANPTTNVDRSQKIDFSAIFTINDLEKAKQATTWVYDLSDFVKDSKAFSQLSGEIGAVMEGDDKAGSYEIKNNAVYLHIDPVWLSEKSEGVKGTFQFSAQLDADKIGQREGDTFNFPGTSSPVTMNYEKVDIGVNNKRVTAADGTAEDSSGVIALRKTADGTYKLKYSMDVTPNANLTTLKLTDIMSAGQTLDTDSVVLYDGGNNYNKLSASFTDGENGSKVLDLAQVLKSNGSSVKKDCNYKVEYTVTIESKDLNTTLEKTNKASWAFDGGSKAGGETSVKTKKELTISKAVTTTDNANSQDVDEAEYSYTITVGEQGEDLSGYVLTDTMSDNQLVKGDITLNYGGKTVTVEPSSDFTDSTFVAGTNNTKQLFTYSFPKGTTGPCTVTYTTKLPKVEDAKETLIKWQDITNTSTVTDTNGDTGTASTKKSHNFTQPRVDKAWNISKAFKDYSAHDDGDVLNWTVTIKSDNDIYSADTPIYLYEDEFTYGYGAYATYNKQMTVLWDQITVASAVEGGTVPEIHHQLENDTYGRDCIKITGMTGPIVLTIPTKLASGDHYIDTDGRSFYAKNKAGFKDDSVYKNAEAYTEHQISEYRMSKDVKYDRDTKEYTWTVSINPDQRVISPDQKEVLFRDDIPEGMELVDFGNVAGKQLYIDSNYRDINAAATLTKDGDIDTLDILALYYAKNQWWHPDGLSGNYFTIQYKTKLKDSEYNALKSMPDGKTYTNTAYQVDSNGKTIKSKDKTVTATYDAVQKYDDSAQYLGNDDVIEYRVLVNKDASELNGGKNLTLTDVMSTDVDLNVSTVEIKDPSGNAIDGAKASYTERNRTLKITIPDRTYAVVTFKVRARDTGSKQYENSVTLQAQNTYTDKVSGNHNITGHGATIQGSADTVTINKFDRDDMSKVLPGAEFTLWKCEVGTDGTIDDNKKTVVGTYTTDAKGQVKFADLDQVCLYQFKETKAPAGYQKDDTVWNFILYNSDKSNQQQAWDLDTKIETKYKDQNMKVASIPDRYTWNMDNAAVEEGTIIINKTVAGLTDSEETDLWSKLTFTAKSTDTNKTEEYQSVYDPAKKTYTISGLTYDTYTITESGNAVSSYDMTVTGLSPATIDADHKVVEEDVTNTYTKNTGKLVIQKILAGNAASTADTFTFNIEAKTKDGANLSGTYSGVTFTDGNATVTLNGGKFKDGVTENNLTADYSNNGGVAKVIEGLPLGATFTVTESQVAGYEQTYFLSYKEQLYENGQKVQETVNGELKDKKKSVVTRGSNSGTISIDQRIVTVVNRRNEVTLSKKNLGGEKIGGAKLQIKDSQDNVVDIWTTDEGQDHKVVLTAGTYTLHEESAPEHYVAASDITFTVDEDGNVKIGEDSVDEVTMTDDYAYHDVEISKQNIAGNGLGNAKLQILDSNQNAVKGEDNKEIIWTSQADQNQTVQLKPGSYILREINAPENYAKDADIAFTVELDGTVKVNDKAADNHTLLMVDDYASHIVMISKADVGGELIPDAQMKVVDASGKDVDSWTTEKGQEKQLSLKPGNYILKEVKAPANYIKAQDIPFTVTVDGTVQINNRAQKDPKVRMVDQYTNHELKISKTDANGAILPGAVMVLSNTSGFNRRWTSKDKAESIIVKPGSYTLHEESAPQGYAAVSDYIISVSVDGKITLSDLKTGSKGILQSNEIELKNDVILVKDSVIPQKVVISKQDIGGNEIPGAFLTVTDMDGRQVGDTILTDGINKHEISLVPGTYTLTETTAPKGYKQAESILFTVGTDGKVAIKGDKTDGNEVVMVDNFVKGRIAVTKHSVTTDGRKLKGCGYILTTKQKVENKIVVSAIETDQISYYTGVDKDGTALWSDKEADAVEKVTGEDGIAVFEGVTIGEYTAYEKTAPKGYAVDTDPIKVNVIGTDLGNTDAEAHATAAAQADQRITKISKVDVTSKQELAGAHIQILDKNGNVVKDAFGNSMEWDSTTEAHEVVGLQTNVEYTLRETVAPNGYTVTSDTKFTIDDQDKVTGTASTTTDKDGNTVLLVEDAKTSVKISKVDITSGKELAGAHIQIIDKETGKVVEIDGKKVEWDSTSTAHEVTGLIAGKTYILRETVAPEGYDITTDTEFTLDQYGRITGTAAVKNGVILVQDAKTKKAVVTRKTGTAAPASRTSRVGGAQTGDTAPITAAAGILSAAVLVLAILIRRRKYTK